MGERLKALGVGILSLRHPVKIKGRKGRAWIEGINYRVFRILDLFFDMRRRPSGATWIQLRKRK